MNLNQILNQWTQRKVAKDIAIFERNPKRLCLDTALTFIALGLAAYSSISEPSATQEYHQAVKSNYDSLTMTEKVDYDRYAYFSEFVRLLPVASAGPAMLLTVSLLPILLRRAEDREGERK